MADVFSKLKRSEIMSKVKNKHTAPEITVRSALHRAGLRFRLHTDLPGTPDVVLPKFKAVVFVHGCLWHGHANCRRAKLPATNRAFWIQKIERNKRRDSNAKRALHRLGWRTFIVWQCDISPGTMSQLSERIRGDNGKKTRSRT